MAAPAVVQNRHGRQTNRQRRAQNLQGWTIERFRLQPEAWPDSGKKLFTTRARAMATFSHTATSVSTSG